VFWANIGLYPAQRLFYRGGLPFALGKSVALADGTQCMLDRVVSLLKCLYVIL